MIPLKPPQNENSFRFKLKSLPLVARQYLSFMAIAQSISALVSLFFIFHENALCGFVQILLVSNLIYLFVAIIVIGMSSRYNRERSMIVAIIPAFMVTLGYLIAFWLSVEIFDDSLSYGDILLALLTIFFAPVATSFLDKSLSVKAAKLYTSSVLQIVISVLILWLEIYYFL